MSHNTPKIENMILSMHRIAGEIVLFPNQQKHILYVQHTGIIGRI